MIEQQLEIYKKEIDQWDRTRTRNMASSGLVGLTMFYNSLSSSIFINFRLWEFSATTGTSCSTRSYPDVILKW